MKIIKAYLIGLFIIVMVSCGPGSEEKRKTLEENGAGNESPKAITDTGDRDVVAETAFANIESASGSNLTGQATFTRIGDNQIRFELQVEHVTPGQHAVHLHENGDCSATDASSAGGHWNPTNQPHGKRGNSSSPFHKGDIGNLEVGADSTGSMTMEIMDWCIGGANDCNILDKAVIVHADPDDFTTQPSGAAGDRIGCGVITDTLDR